MGHVRLNPRVRQAMLGLAFVAATAVAHAGELSVEDFKFDGPLGSQGAKIEKIDRNRFKVTLGHAPEHADWPNMMQFQIVRNAKGNDLKMVGEFATGTSYGFNAYFYSWSYDGKDWRPIRWNRSSSSAKGETMLSFPVFEQDTVFVGHQVPLSYEDMVAMIDGWKKDPAVKVHVVGESLGKRSLYRIEITDPNSPVPPAQRWVHYFANQHPGEHNSQWRMVGMIDWLLSDEGADARKRFLCHFVLMMSPDAPSNGWYRVNAQGLDMNRTYCVGGANPAQGHEPYLWQKDLEAIMASPCPATTIWAMHTWPGATDPSMLPGPEVGTVVGPATLLGEIILRQDPNHELCKDLKIDKRVLRSPGTQPASRPAVRPASRPAARPASGPPTRPGGGAWSSGPHAQFGVTAFLCEGAGALYTKKQNVDSGVLLIKSLAEYYKGTRRSPP